MVLVHEVVETGKKVACAWSWTFYDWKKVGNITPFWVTNIILFVCLASRNQELVRRVGVHSGGGVSAFVRSHFLKFYVSHTHRTNTMALPQSFSHNWLVWSLQEFTSKLESLCDDWVSACITQAWFQSWWSTIIITVIIIIVRTLPSSTDHATAAVSIILVKVFENLFLLGYVTVIYNYMILCCICSVKIAPGAVVCEECELIGDITIGNIHNNSTEL